MLQIIEARPSTISCGQDAGAAESGARSASGGRRMFVVASSGMHGLEEGKLIHAHETLNHHERFQCGAKHPHGARQLHEGHRLPLVRASTMAHANAELCDNERFGPARLTCSLTLCRAWRISWYGRDCSATSTMRSAWVAREK